MLLSISRNPMVSVIASLFLLIFVSQQTLSSRSKDLISMPLTRDDTSRLYLPYLSREFESSPIRNGDFEQGPLYWGEYSLQGWALILPASLLPVVPHSGNWAVWLGGDYDEVSGIWQEVIVPNQNPVLQFWYWIASADLCGYDVGGVSVNLEVVVDAFWLCEATETHGWVLRTVNLSAFAGQTVEIDILVGTDWIFNSHLFIDDVSVGGPVIALDYEIHDAGNVHLVAKSSLIAQSDAGHYPTLHRDRPYEELLRGIRDISTLSEGG